MITPQLTENTKPAPRQVYFVTGTDTDVGKTFVCELLLRRAVLAGGKAYALKPITSGCVLGPTGEKISRDAQRLMACSNVPLDEQMVAPIKLLAAQSPHIAAAAENTRITADRVVGVLRGALSTASSHVLIEGAGGWRVPINQHETLATIAKMLGKPVILVVTIRLGCINHALLTAEAIRRDGLQLAGWIANSVAPENSDESAQIESLQHLLHAPCLGIVPFMANIHADYQVALNHLSMRVRWPNEQSSNTAK